MSWYYAVNGERRGPVSESEFATLVSGGSITDATLVWRDGMADWKPWGTVKPASPANPFTAAGVPEAAPVAEETAVCAASGRIYPKREMIQYEGRWISAEHRDAYFQRIRQGLTQPGQLQYAGFWIRFVAKLIDSILLGIVNTVVNMLVFGVAAVGLRPSEENPAAAAAFVGIYILVMIFNFSLGLFYNWIFLKKFQATLGKLALGLKVVRADGSRLTNGRIIGRYFAEILSSITLTIGYIIAAFDNPEKRALHDHVCDTRVVRK